MAIKDGYGTPRRGRGRGRGRGGGINSDNTEDRITSKQEQGTQKNEDDTRESGPKSTEKMPKRASTPRRRASSTIKRRTRSRSRSGKSPGRNLKLVGKGAKRKTPKENMMEKATAAYASIFYAVSGTTHETESDEEENTGGGETIETADMLMEETNQEDSDTGDSGDYKVRRPAEGQTGMHKYMRTRSGTETMDVENTGETDGDSEEEEMIEYVGTKSAAAPKQSRMQRAEQSFMDTDDDNDEAQKEDDGGGEKEDKGEEDEQEEQEETEGDDEDTETEEQKQNKDELTDENSEMTIEEQEEEATEESANKDKPYQGEAEKKEYKKQSNIRESKLAPGESPKAKRAIKKWRTHTRKGQTTTAHQRSRTKRIRREQ